MQVLVHDKGFQQPTSYQWWEMNMQIFLFPQNNFGYKVLTHGGLHNYGHLWADDNFKYIYLNHDKILIRISFNSLAPGGFQFNFRKVISKLTLVNGGWGISNEIALRWMPLDLTDDKSTLVQVMAWCRQATSHYLSQCWPRWMSPFGVTRPQRVKGLRPVLEQFVVTM